MPVRSNNHGSYHDGSVKDWVEFLSSKQQLSSVDDMSGPITCIVLRLREDDKADDVGQLVNLLVQAISTHCAVFESLQHFKLEYFGRMVHSEEVAGRNASWAYKASDPIPHHLDAMTRQICRFLGNLPLAITKFTFDASFLHPKLGTLMLASLSENRHLTELNVGLQFVRFTRTQRNPPPWNVREWVEEKFGNNNEVCSSLMRAFFNRETSRLQRFTFPCAPVTELDTEAIKLLKSNNHLQYLYLNGYSLGDAGASLLAEGLKVNKTLKYLLIRNCGVGDQGCMALAEALEVNNTLEELDLENNHFDDAGVHAFVQALRVNHSLRRLLLKSSNYPSYSQETGEELLQVLRHFLLPLDLNLKNAGKREMIYEACHFNRGFDEMCQMLRDGTYVFDSQSSWRWFHLPTKSAVSMHPFLPFLGSTHPFVKQTLLFLLLRQRAEIASKSCLLVQHKS